MEPDDIPETYRLYASVFSSGEASELPPEEVPYAVELKEGTTPMFPGGAGCPTEVP